MSEQADVYVKNVLTGTITATRMLPNGTSDLNVTIATDVEEQIPLASPDVWMVITAPTGLDTKDCPVKVKSDIDLAVAHSRTDSNWTIKIAPNELQPEVPTTVNVTVGNIEPG